MIGWRMKNMNNSAGKCSILFVVLKKVNFVLSSLFFVQDFKNISLKTFTNAILNLDLYFSLFFCSMNVEKQQ